MTATSIMQLFGYISQGDIQVGDVIYWTNNNDPSGIHHAAIITKVTSGDIFYTQHSDDKIDSSLSEYWTRGNERVYIIHIRKSGNSIFYFASSMAVGNWSYEKYRDHWA